MTDYHYNFSIQGQNYEVDLVADAALPNSYKVSGKLAALQALGLNPSITISIELLRDRFTEKRATNISLEKRVGTAAGHVLTPSVLQKRFARIERGITTVDPSNPSTTCSVSIEKLMAQYGVPGASVAIFDNGSICHKGYGTLQNEELFIQAASISKMVTALTVLSLVKDRVLSLEDDVSLILRDYWTSIDENKRTDEAHKVTVRMLLSHTAGTNVPSYHGHPKGTELTTDEIISEVRVIHTPDKDHFEYSGGGTMLLQKIIELKCDKKPFADVVKERVFAPLGMEKSTFTPHAFTATGYGPDGKEVPGGFFSYPEHAAAGLWSTPQELLKIAVEIQKACDGKESIITQSLAQEMLTSQSPGKPNGLGVFVDVLSSSVVFHHPGENAGFKSVLIANNNKQGACIMTNSENGEDLWRDVLRAIVKECKWPDHESLPMCRPLCSPQEIEPADKALWTEKYAGFYRFEDQEIEVTAQALKEKGYPPYEILYLGKGACIFREFNPGPPKKFSFTENASGKICLHVFDKEFSRCRG